VNRPHTTLTGRVVYTRKQHLFTYKRLVRILETLPSPETVDDAASLTLMAVLLGSRMYRMIWSGSRGSGLTILRGWFQGIISVIEWAIRDLDLELPVKENLQKVISLIRYL